MKLSNIKKFKHKKWLTKMPIKYIFVLIKYGLLRTVQNAETIETPGMLIK